MIEIPNIKLCTWMLSAGEIGKNKKKPDAQTVISSYINVWKKAGTQNDKLIEIQNLDLLIEVLTLISPKHLLLGELKMIRKKLKVVIAE